jgi:hypothetical protein
MTTPDDRYDTVERLRVNADRFTAIAGPNWRLVTASNMGCLTFDTGIGPVEQRRDSEPIDVSNFRVIAADLQAIDQRVTTVRFTEHEIGWIDQIAVPLDNPALIDRITQWSHKLARDMVADVADLAALVGSWPHDDT